MKKNQTIIFLALLWGSLTAQAQSFGTGDNQDYASIGVYDTWEESPFRTGVLAGNVKVIENHLYSASGVNRTGHILGIQRSRFGSNTFGARVDLPNTVTIGRSGKYVHALVYTPKASKVQIIGLGKRTSNTWNESADVEQFWSDPVSISANKWTDIVVQVKTNENSEIHSIVVVPDCSSPHNLTADFVAYVDEIVINNSSSKRSSVTSTVDPYEGSSPGGGEEEEDDTNNGIYDVSFSKTTANPRNPDTTGYGTRYLKGVSLQGGSTNYTYTTSSEQRQLIYNDLTASKTVNVVAGQSYQVTLDYSSDWMHGYAYIDYNRDGVFTPVMNSSNTGIEDGSELVSYSAYNPNDENDNGFYNSLGNKSGSNTLEMPTFTIPSNLQSGVYRMRLKVDWNSIDPQGNSNTNNLIANNGGAIVDIVLNVSGVDEVPVTGSQRNGNITDASGNIITTTTALKATHQQAYQVMMVPYTGFGTNALTAIYMHNSTTASGYLVKDTVTYTTSDTNYDSKTNSFTLPAEVMDAEVYLEGTFNGLPSLTGDINKDWQVNISDVTALVDYILGKDTSYNAKTCDVNADNEVNISDVTSLVDIILGK